MSESEVEAKSVSVVGLIEAYEATQQAWHVYESTCRKNNEAIDRIKSRKLQKAHYQADEKLYAAMIHHCDGISHRGKIYLRNTEYQEVIVLEDIREASEIDAESGASAPHQEAPRTDVARLAEALKRVAPDRIYDVRLWDNPGRITVNTEYTNPQGKVRGFLKEIRLDHIHRITNFDLLAESIAILLNRAMRQEEDRPQPLTNSTT